MLLLIFRLGVRFNEATRCFSIRFDFDLILFDNPLILIYCNTVKVKERMLWMGLVTLCLGYALVNKKAAETVVQKADATRVHATSRSSSHESVSSTQAGKTIDERAIPVGGPELQAYVESILRHPDPIFRSRNFIRVLDQVTPESYFQVSAAWKKLRLAGTYLVIEEKMMNYRAGELMGRAILEGRKGSSRDLSMVHALRDQFAGWVSADSADAQDWLKSLDDGPFKSAMNETYLQTLALHDPEKVLALGTGADAEMQRAAGGRLASAIKDTQSIKAASEFLLAKTGQVNDTNQVMYQAYFDNLAQGCITWDRNTAAQLLEEHLDQPYVNASLYAHAAALRGKHDGDPSSMLDWLQRVSSKSAQQFDLSSILRGAFDQMNEQKWALAEQWAQQTQDPHMKALVEDFVVAKRQESAVSGSSIPEP